jgi:hypothetical protein
MANRCVVICKSGKRCKNSNKCGIHSRVCEVCNISFGKKLNSECGHIICKECINYSIKAMYPGGFNTDDKLSCPVCCVAVNDTDWSNFGDIIIEKNNYFSRTIVYAWYINAFDRTKRVNINDWDKDLFEKEMDFYRTLKFTKNHIPHGALSSLSWREIHKVYFEINIPNKSKYIVFNIKNHWLTIKCAVKFLSLHHRAIITANHPERKFQRGEFLESS